ncbi:phage holin family protein [Rhodohalobacter sp. SW132]|uniref:phage holin family protein n=1 Tax=Rhodohalobacter sp. SW132 TaxID=2293433 RepID=UPI000E2828D2|nr:phage holin family protein [Rhodohalobacter sp. SW132]REL33250.1 phage holin family protein [Rhodohalobacter sp. SW132]
MIKTLLINSIVIFLGAHLLSGVTIKNYWTAIGVAIVLAIMNMFIRPLIVLLTLPLTIITLGLFVLVINAWILMLTDKFVDGLKIKNFGWAVLYGLLISVLNSFLLFIF